MAGTGNSLLFWLNWQGDFSFVTVRGLAKRRWQDVFHSKNLPQRVLHVRPYMRVENDSSRRGGLEYNTNFCELKIIYS